MTSARRSSPLWSTACARSGTKTDTGSSTTGACASSPPGTHRRPEVQAATWSRPLRLRPPGSRVHVPLVRIPGARRVLTVAAHDVEQTVAGRRAHHVVEDRHDDDLLR